MLTAISTTSVSVPNTLVIGASQKGKTTYVFNYDFKPTVQEGKCFTLLLDPHASFGQEAAEWCIAKGHGHRLIVIDLAKIEWVCAFGFTERCTLSNQAEREAENRSRARAFVEACFEDRGVSLDERPQIKEWTMAAMELWQFHPDAPLEWLLWAFKPKTPIFDKLVDQCPDQMTRLKFQALRTFSGTTLHREVGPAVRLLEELFKEPAFRYRIEPTFDLAKAVHDKLIVIILGGADQGLNRKIMRLANMRADQIVRENWAATGEPLLCRTYFDEAASVGTVKLRESRDMAQTLKMGKSNCVIIQALNFGDPLIDENVAQNTQVHLWFGCHHEKVTRDGALDLLPLLNSHRIHSQEYRDRLVMDGYEQITSESEGSSVGPDGKERKDKRKNFGERPTYTTVTDTTTRYFDMKDQIIELQQKLMALEVGQCYRKAPEGVSLLQGQKFPDPWTFPGLGKKKLQRLLDQHKELGLLRPAVLPSVPCPEPTKAPKPPKKPGKKS